jgi:hypothetical protein
MILYLKDPRNSAPKLQHTINCYSKVAGWKIKFSSSKNHCFLYNNNEQNEKEYGVNSIYNSLKKNQIPRSKLNKEWEWPLQGELKTSEERDWGRLQKVERSPMLLGW